MQELKIDISVCLESVNENLQDWFKKLCSHQFAYMFMFPNNCKETQSCREPTALHRVGNVNPTANYRNMPRTGLDA